MNAKSIFITTALSAIALAVPAQQRGQLPERVQGPQRTPDPQTQAIIIEPDPDHGYWDDRGHRGLRAEIWTDDDLYYVGDSMEVRFRVSTDANVYVFNTDARGVTTQIFPNFYDQNNYVRGGRTYTLPRHGYDFRIAGPPGTETVEIYAVTDTGRIRHHFDSFSQSNPYPTLSSEGRAALNSIHVVPEPSPRPNAVIVVPDRPVYASDTDIVEFDVIDPRRPPVHLGGELVIHSSPGHAGITIDDQFIGYTPATVANLAPGYHAVRIHRPGFRTHVEQVHVRAGSETVIRINLRRGYNHHYGGSYESDGSFSARIDVDDNDWHVGVDVGRRLQRVSHRRR